MPEQISLFAVMGSFCKLQTNKFPSSRVSNLTWNKCWHQFSIAPNQDSFSAFIEQAQWKLRVYAASVREGTSKVLVPNLMFAGNEIVGNCISAVFKKNPIWIAPQPRSISNPYLYVTIP